jgi:hypothetical protein
MPRIFIFFIIICLQNAKNHYIEHIQIIYENFRPRTPLGLYLVEYRSETHRTKMDCSSYGPYPNFDGPGQLDMTCIFFHVQKKKKKKKKKKKTYNHVLMFFQ